MINHGGIRAGDLVDMHGDALLGRSVHTIQCGHAWPGGRAIITELGGFDGRVAYIVEHPVAGPGAVYRWEPAELLED